MSDPRKSSAGELTCEEEQESLDKESNKLFAAAHVLREQLIAIQQLDQDFARTLDRMEADKSAAAFEITKSQLALTADSLQQTAQIFCGTMSVFGRGQTQLLGEVCEVGKKLTEAAYALKNSAECAGGNGMKCLQAASWVSKHGGKALSKASNGKIDQLAQKAKGMAPSELGNRVAKERSMEILGKDLQIAGTIGSLGTNTPRTADGDSYAGFKAGEDVCDIPSTMGDKKLTEACKTAVRGTRIIHNSVEYGKADKLGEELDESLERQIQKAQEKRRQIQDKEESLRQQITAMNEALAPIVQGQLFKKEVTHPLRCEPEKDKSVVDLENEIDRMANAQDETRELPGLKAEGGSSSSTMRSLRDQLRSYRNQQALREASRPQRETPSAPSSPNPKINPPAVKWSCPGGTVSASGQGCDYEGNDFHTSLPGYNDSRPVPGDKKR